ncbi:hypothetical protein HDU86_000533 [Geranomyces michiganensis]|nr:hypothetical protein HDU86_000533 [Geranomyces michiganensis]
MLGPQPSMLSRRRPSTSNIYAHLPCSPRQHDVLLTSSTLTFSLNLPLDPKVDFRHSIPEAWQELRRLHPVLRTVIVQDPESNGWHQAVLHEDSPSQVRFVQEEADPPSALASDGALRRPTDVVPVDLVGMNRASARAVMKFSAMISRRRGLMTPDGKIGPVKPLSSSEAPECTVSFGANGNKLTISAPSALVNERAATLICHDFAALHDKKELPGARTPFSSYVESILRRDSTAAKKYWTNHLATVTPTSFPHTRLIGGGHLESEAFARRSFQFDNYEDFAGLAESLQVAPGVILATVWALVMSLHADSDAVVMGAYDEAPGPPSSDGELPAIGRTDVLFPLAVKVQKEALLATLIQNIGFAFSAGSDNAFIGLKEIAQRSQTPDASLFRTAVRFPITDFDSSRFDIEDHENCLAIVSASRNGAGLQVNLKFDSNIMSEAKAAIVLDQCELILAQIVAKPTMHVNSLSYVSKPHRQRLLELTEPYRLSPPAATLTARFEAASELHAREPAVQFENTAPITYTQLNHRANRLARHLMSLGVTRNVLVPLVLPRSVDLICGILAVLKAGGAYVPLDQDHPIERNLSIIRELESPVLITTSSLASKYKVSGVSLICPDALTDVLGKLSSANPSPPRSRPEDAAFLIFSSGTGSGAPKGVLLTHANANAGIVPTHGAGTRSLLFYNHIFSAAQRTILASLLSGAVLCLATGSNLTVNLKAVLEDMRITDIGLTPSVAALLPPQGCPSLKRVRITGESMTADLLENLCEHYQSQTCYGISECTMLNMGRVLSPSANPLLVGRPNDTTSAYVLNDDLTVAPFFGVGELCLSGPQVSQGYFKKPELTAKAFVPNPFRPGTMLYRTGDLAKQDENGDIEVLGRRDYQLKIDGQKVDCAEIAAAILEHPLVRQAVVVVNEVAKQKMLVAYVVGDNYGDVFEDVPATVEWFQVLEEIREVAAKRLPKFMLPRVWLPTKALKTTSSGKVNLHQLRSVVEKLGLKSTLAYSIPEHDKAALSSVNERLLQKVWAKVLGLANEDIGAEDSFVKLGGTSLQAIQVAIACRDFGYEIEVADVVQGANLQSLAASLRMRDDEEAHVMPPFSLLGRTPLEAKKMLIADNILPPSVKFEDVEDIYPCTPLQEGLVALELTQPGSYVYQRIFELDSDVDLDRLRSAWESTVRATPILRTTFAFAGRNDLGGLQILLKENRIPWNEYSIGHDFASLRAYLDADAQNQMQLGDAHVRVGLLRHVDDGTLQIVFSVHHALFDFWSWKFMFADLTRAYREQPAIPRPPFKNFIQHLKHLDHGVADSFWKKYMSGAEQTVIGSPGAGETGFGSVRGEWTFDAKRTAAAFGATSSSLVYSAWALVLSKHTGSSDVTFGTVLSGREGGVRDILVMNGPTLSTVPQRIAVDANSTARDFVRRNDFAFWDLVRFSAVGMQTALTSAGHNSSLFNTLVNIIINTRPNDSEPVDAEDFFPLSMSGERPSWQTQYITLDVQPEADVMKVRINFNRADISDRQAEFLLDQFLTALEELTAAPETTAVGEVVAIGTAEKEFIMSLTPAPVTLPGELLLHRGFEHSAAKTPHALAVQFCANDPLTYQEVNERANQFAHYLIEHGMMPNDPVPLCVAKSAEMIIMMLAILKAGGGYVPLDAENPIERNRFIAQDTDAKLAVVECANVPILEECGLDLVSYETLDLSSYPTTNPVVPGLTKNCLAYIIYTSGSTGLPKGAMLPHEAAASATRSISVAQKLLPSARVLQFSNITWDASVMDIYCTLCVGATLCIAPKQDMLSDLAGVMNEMEVTELFMTPTIARLITPEQVPSLRSVFIGGECLTPDVILTYDKLFFENIYGPTEVCISCVTATVEPGHNPQVIGKTLPTVGAYILSDKQTLVPFGAVGELCFVGPQLASGYLKRPDITSKVFVPNPFSPGERMYLSGDLGRYLPDGTIECIGRRDQQVKLNGLRIELGEIENHTKETGIVGECVAVVAKSAAGGSSSLLVAFVTFPDHPATAFACAKAAISDGAGDVPTLPRDEFEDDIELIGNCLSLPAYMVPRIWIPVARIPRMASGKTDRKKLTAYVESLNATQLAALAGADSSTLSPPTTLQEKLLATIWSEVLHVAVTDLGLQSNFFQLGGDSIKAMKLVSRCRAERYDISNVEVMSNSKLVDMAAHMMSQIEVGMR